MHGAGLTWAKKSVEIEVFAPVEAVTFKFSFQNQGSLPVKIDKAEADCGCVVTAPIDGVFPAKARGEISGSYTPGDQRGIRKVRMIVKGRIMDGDKLIPFEDVLNVNIIVRPMVTVTPGILYWLKNSEPIPKAVRFEVSASLLMQLRFAKISDNAFFGKWREVEAGRVFELIVVPASTAASRQALTTVEAEGKNGEILKFYVHLMVR